MRTFLSMAANRLVDKYAIQSCGIPGQLLMQQAGQAAVREMKRRGFLKGKPSVLVLSGKGNNGGDGYVITRQLMETGLAVELIIMTPADQLTGDAQYHYQQLPERGVAASVWSNSADQLTMIQQADVIVDALLGTGIAGELRQPYQELIAACNASSARVVAVDVPSGVSGDLGHILQPCIKAELTVSMGFGKQGCLFEPARSQCGALVPVEIGFPADSLEQIKEPVLREIEARDFQPELFTRLPQAHKYATGKVYLIAGSRGFTGAALLAATAALRSGAGLVKLALPESLGSLGEGLSLETIVEYLPETADQSFAAQSLPQLLMGCEWADTVIIGPGLGRSVETQQLARELIPRIQRPLVIDADALFALADDLELLKKRQAPTLLTPHAGEFKRLVAMTGAVQPDWRDARELAMEFRVNVLLKGAPSVLASPDGQVSVNSTGYSGMATAGSGDVLSGVIGALWAQWPEHPAVLKLGMYAHGRAADLNHKQKGVLGLIASDIIKKLPAALEAYGGIPH